MMDSSETPEPLSVAEPARSGDSSTTDHEQGSALRGGCSVEAGAEVGTEIGTSHHTRAEGTDQPAIARDLSPQLISAESSEQSLSQSSPQSSPQSCRIFARAIEPSRLTA